MHRNLSNGLFPLQRTVMRFWDCVADNSACMLMQIHTGSPWIESRPVFVLVQQQPNSEIPVTYTLKTKVSWTAAEDEISKVVQLRRQLS